MEDDIIKGTDAFLESSDNFFKKVAEYIDSYEINNESLTSLRDVCEIVRITATTIKTLREDGKEKKKSPLERVKAKSSGEQILV